LVWAHNVIPAKAEIQNPMSESIPAFAGMTTTMADGFIPIVVYRDEVATRGFWTFVDNAKTSG